MTEKDHLDELLNNARERPLNFELFDTKGNLVFEQKMARRHYPGIVVWGGRAFRLDDIQSASPAPAKYVERETFVIGRDT